MANRTGFLLVHEIEKPTSRPKFSPEVPAVNHHYTVFAVNREISLSQEPLFFEHAAAKDITNTKSEVTTGKISFLDYRSVDIVGLATHVYPFSYKRGDGFEHEQQHWPITTELSKEQVDQMPQKATIISNLYLKALTHLHAAARNPWLIHCPSKEGAIMRRRLGFESRQGNREVLTAQKEMETVARYLQKH